MLTRGDEWRTHPVAVGWQHKGLEEKRAAPAKSISDSENGALDDFEQLL